MSARLKPVSPTLAEAASPVRIVEPQDRANAPSSAVSSGARGSLLRRRPWIYGIAGVAIGLMAGTAATHLGGGSKTPAAVVPSQAITVGQVEKGTMTRSLVVNGSLAAWDELPIGTEAGGLAIIQVDVEEGDRVTPGQLLARLDDAVPKAELAQAEAAVAQAEAGLRKAEAMATTAGSEANRARELSKNAYISGQVAEQRQTALTTAQADVNLARQNLEAAKAVRAERTAQLAQTEIRAPTAGIISKRMATLGNVVGVGQQLFRLIRDGRVELRAEVPEIDLLKLTAGQTVKVAAGERDERQFDGHIRLVGATVDPQTRIGIVYVALPDDPLLKPGMFVHGVVDTGQSQVLQIQEESIVYKDGKPAVFVIDAENRSRLRMVETGQRRDGYVEIREGLTEGERIALAGAGYLKDNDVVRVEQPLPSSEARQPAAGVVR